MRRTAAVIAIAGGLLLLGTPSADAAYTHYVGSCTVDAWNGYSQGWGSGRTKASCPSVQVRTHMDFGIGQKTEFDGDVTKPDPGNWMSHTDHNWNPGTGWVGFPLSCC